MPLADPGKFSAAVPVYSKLEGNLPKVKRGETAAADVGEAVAELASQIAQPDACVALVFASSHYDPDAFAAAIQDALGDTPVVGCTSIGEIGAHGFTRGGATGVTIASDSTRVGLSLQRDLATAGLTCGRNAVLDASAQLDRPVEDLSPAEHVGLCLIDWRSQAEELFMAGASASAPALSFVGGSSSDQRVFAPESDGGFLSRVFFRGEAVAAAGILVMLETKDPFRVLVTEHMHPREGRVVVTRADPARRLVFELDGKPALVRYREVFQLDDGELTNQVAGQCPFGYYVEGRAFVRSVMAVDGDALQFACGVDRGTALVPMRPGDMIATTDEALSQVSDDLHGDMAALIAFSCYGRFLECEASGTVGDVGSVLAKYPVVGLNTFGEQVNSLHVNHTLTGLALGVGSG